MKFQLGIVFLFAICFISFLMGIDFPGQPYFDEFYYVNDARNLLQSGHLTHLEHPLLGRELIAAGMAIVGDNPMGWRVASAFFGALTATAIFVWAFILFDNLLVALLTLILTYLNQLLFLQSRLATLDVFLFTWISLGLVFFTSYFKKRRILYLYCSGIFFGLATSVKWFGIFPWAVCLAVGFRFSKKSRHWLMHFVTAFGVLPILIYICTYLPLFLVNKAGDPFGLFLKLQIFMWTAQTDSSYLAANPHPVEISRWWSWPFKTEPMWLYSNADSKIGLLGNPVMMYLGFCAIIFCVWEVWKRHHPEAVWILMYYAVLYLPWAMISREQTFYHYYYPPGMVLSLALGYVLWSWEKRSHGYTTFRRYLPPALLVTASLASWIYYFPILTGK